MKTTLLLFLLCGNLAASGQKIYRHRFYQLMEYARNPEAVRDANLDRQKAADAQARRQHYPEFYNASGPATPYVPNGDESMYAQLEENGVSMAYAISLNFLRDGSPLYIRYENQSPVTGTRYPRELTDSALAAGFRLVGRDTLPGDTLYDRTFRTRLQSDGFSMTIEEAEFQAPVPTRKRRSTEKRTQYWYFVTIRRR